MFAVLILTFLVTSADSGLLLINTIMAGGETGTSALHRILWGGLLTLVIAALILPFAFVMVAMCVSLAKALYRDHHRDRLSRERESLAVQSKDSGGKPDARHVPTYVPSAAALNAESAGLATIRLRHADLAGGGAASQATGAAGPPASVAIAEGPALGVIFSAHGLFGRS